MFYVQYISSPKSNYTAYEHIPYDGRQWRVLVVGDRCQYLFIASDKDNEYIPSNGTLMIVNWNQIVHLYYFAIDNIPFFVHLYWFEYSLHPPVVKIPFEWAWSIPYVLDIYWQFVDIQISRLYRNKKNNNPFFVCRYYGNIIVNQSDFFLSLLPLTFCEQCKLKFKWYWIIHSLLTWYSWFIHDVQRLK